LCFVLDWQVIYILTQSEDFLLIGKAFFEPRDYRVVFVLQKRTGSYEPVLCILSLRTTR